MKVLIVNPSRFYSGNWGAGDLSHLFVLYSYLRQHCPGVEVDVLDLERELFTPEDANEEAQFLRLARAALQSTHFDLVGISCWTSLHYLSTIAVANLCKTLNPDCKIVVGGYHPSSIPEDFSYRGTPFDYVVTGEGEEAFRRIVMGEVPQETRPQLVAGTPAETADQRLYWEEYRYYRNAEKVQLWMTRGCPFACGFCLDRNTKWRGRTPQQAIAEVRRVAEQIPSVKKIAIMDPIFGLRKEWRREVLDGLIAADLDVRYWAETRGDLLEEEDIARLGALDFQMDIGIDSVSPRMIEIMMKAKSPERYVEAFLETSRLMDKHKVTHFIYGIFNYPGETPATLLETRQFWTRYYEQHQNGHGLFLAQPFAFFPGCEVYTNFANYQERYGARVLQPEWWKIARPSHAKRATQIIPSRELAEARQLFLYKEVQKSINVLATKTVSRTVIDQFLLDMASAKPQLRAPPVYRNDKHLRVGDSTHYLEKSERKAVFFNFDREETRECSDEEAEWVDELLDGATPGKLRERIGADARGGAPALDRLDKFLDLAVSRQYLSIASERAAPGMDPSGTPTRVRIETNLGALAFTLLSEAPATAANFASLALGGYYNGLPIATARAGAYIEAGSLMPGDPGPGGVVSLEPSPLPHTRGVLTMAPARSSAVFAICRGRWEEFDGIRTAFGVMTEGFEVLDRLMPNDVIIQVTVLTGVYESELPRPGTGAAPLAPRQPEPLVQLGFKPESDPDY